jgi:hypothetical protein
MARIANCQSSLKHLKAAALHTVLRSRVMTHNRRWVKSHVNDILELRQGTQDLEHPVSLSSAHASSQVKHGLSACKNTRARAPGA